MRRSGRAGRRRAAFAAALLAAAAAAATLPFYLAGQRARAVLAAASTAVSRGLPAALVIERYRVGVYRSALTATLRVDTGTGRALRVPLNGTVEHGLTATRVLLRHAPEAGPLPPVRLAARIAHWPPWTTDWRVAGTLDAGGLDLAAHAGGWRGRTAPLAARFDCRPDRCRLDGELARVALDAGARGAVRLEGLSAKLALSAGAGRVSIALHGELAGGTLRRPGVLLEAARLRVDADGAPRPGPRVVLGVESLVHRGLPYLRLEQLAARARPLAERGRWRIAGDAESNYGPFDWHATLVLPGARSDGSTADADLALEARVPARLVDLVARQHGVPLAELERAGWLERSGARYRLGAAYRRGRWRPALERGGT